MGRDEQRAATGLLFDLQRGSWSFIGSGRTVRTAAIETLLRIHSKYSLSTGSFDSGTT